MVLKKHINGFLNKYMENKIKAIEDKYYMFDVWLTTKNGTEYMGKRRHLWELYHMCNINNVSQNNFMVSFFNKGLSIGNNKLGYVFNGKSYDWKNIEE